MIENAETGTHSLLSQVDEGIVAHIQELFRTAVRRIRTRLVNRSSVDIPVRIGTADIGRFGPAMDRLQQHEGGAFIRFRLMPGNMSGLMVIEGALLFRLTGLMLGEDPWGEPPLYRWRALTSVDLAIARRIAEDVLAGLADACPPTLGPFANIEQVSASPRISFPLARSTMVVEAGLDFGPPTEPFGLVTIILPNELASILGPKRLELRDRADPARLNRVLPVELDAVAELAHVKMDLGDVRKLTLGQVIPLGALHDVILRVEGKPTLACEAGSKDGIRALRMKHRITDS